MIDDRERIPQTLRYMASLYAYAARRRLLEDAANEIEQLERALTKIRDTACGETQCKQEARLALWRDKEAGV